MTAKRRKIVGILSRNKGIENGDGSDERELFEDEHLSKAYIFSADEITHCKI